jgi:hypothetical protein
MSTIFLNSKEKIDIWIRNSVVQIADPDLYTNILSIQTTAGCKFVEQNF